MRRESHYLHFHNCIKKGRGNDRNIGMQNLASNRQTHFIMDDLLLRLKKTKYKRFL